MATRTLRAPMQGLRPFLKSRSFAQTAWLNPFIYHPQSRTLEPEVQALNLTKTVQMEKFSSCLPDTIIDPLLREDMMSKFRQNVIQTRLFNYEGEVATRDLCALPLMQNMLRVIWSHSSRFPVLLESSLSYKPYVSAWWERESNQLQVSGKLGFLLSSKSQLAPVASSEEIIKTEEIQIEKPDIISPVFNLHKLPTKKRFDTGFYPGAPYPHPHTIIIVNTNIKWKTSDLVAQGILFTFGRLVADAVSNHNCSLGEVLKKPLTAQCVITDGIRLSFLFYQLNTLDLKHDEGVKNIACISPGVLMYEKAVLKEIPGLKMKDPVTFEAEIQGFNEECFETFIKMILNGL